MSSLATFAILLLTQPPTPSPLTAQRMKIWKKWKNTWRYHCFTQVYQKSWSKSILFLRYGVCRMWLLFFLLSYFLPFHPPNSPKDENIIKMKNLIIKLEICQKQTFHIITMTSNGIFGLCFFHIYQLVTHLAVYRLPCSYVTSLLVYCRG